MGSYRYQVRGSGGQVQSGVLTADTAATAAAILRNQGAHVVSLAPVKGGDGSKASLAEFWQKINSSKPTQKQVLDFTSQLAVMTRAGI
ncbi:MAG: hypothetical protein AAFY58_06350, partial [Planctomycetota bacterium]